jgi:hypothetical protein
MDFEAELERHDAAWDEAKERNRELGEGLVEGKVVRFQVADGYAVYEIVEIGDEVSRVKYRPEMCLDNYRSEAVNQGRIFTDTLEAACKRWDFFINKL